MIKLSDIILNESYVSEISPDLRNKAIGAMKDSGMPKKADKWDTHYLNKDLSEFIGVSVLGGFVISSFKRQEPYDDSPLSTPMSVKLFGNSPERATDSTYLGEYVIARDYWDLNHYVFEHNYRLDRRSARILSKIAIKLNPKTKYSNFKGDFKIIDRD